MKYIIDRSQFVDENKHEPMSCVVNSRIEKAVFFVGAHPRVQKRWMTLGSHPWVRWIGLTGALHDLTRPRKELAVAIANDSLFAVPTVTSHPSTGGSKVRV